MLALNAMDLMRATWPRHAAKHAARAADCPVATAKAWVQGRFTPSADTLLRMAARNDKLRAELLRRLGEHGYAENAANDGGVVASRDGRVAGEVGGRDRPAGPADQVDAVGVRGRGR